MYPEKVFEVVRVILVSIVHGISLGILVNGGKNDRKLVVRAMVLLSIFVAILGSIIIFYVPSEFANVSWIAYMMLVAMGIVFCLCSTGSTMTERLFVYIMYVAVFMLNVGYANFIANIFFPSDIEEAQLVIRTITSVVIIILLKSFLRDSLYSFIDGLGTHGFEITMFSWLIGLCVLEYAIFAFFFIDSPIANLSILGLLTLMIISIFVIAHRIVKLTDREIEIEKIIGRQHLLESELEVEKAFVERAKAIRHDQRHHDRIVLEYLKEGNIEEAMRYLGAHDVSVISESLVSWCSNPLLDAQLRIAWRNAASNNVAFSADIQLPESLGIDDIDLVSIFGNLIENAIQAASGTASPSVSILSKISNGKLLLEIRNTFDESNQKSEGTGLESVKYILSQYGGMLVQESCDGLFFSRVIMPLRKQR